VPQIRRLADDLDELARVIVNARLTYDDIRPSAALCHEAADCLRVLWREVQAMRLLASGPALPSRPEQFQDGDALSGRERR
jgi:hypothetical protein